MDYKQYTEANREAWNEVTPKHQKARKENLMEKFKENDYNALDPIETAKLLELGVKGKRIAQLCCNNGKDLLSLLNLGAISGVGFDISDEAIKEANRLQVVSGGTAPLFGPMFMRLMRNTMDHLTWFTSRLDP